MITNSYNSRQAAMAQAARHTLLEILAGSLSPETLVAAIHDLAANDQIDGGDDQMIADQAANRFERELRDRLGNVEAERRITCCGTDPINDLDIAARECAKDTAQINA